MISASLTSYSKTKIPLDILMSIKDADCDPARSDYALRRLQHLRPRRIAGYPFSLFATAMQR